MTILRGERRLRQQFWGDEESVVEEVGGNGGALVVLAVSLPFVVVAVLASPFGQVPQEDTRVTIDLRKVLLGRVSEEFVYALTKEPVDLSRWNRPKKPVRVVGVKQDPQVSKCKKCGGPWPEHSKNCSSRTDRRR